MLHFFNRALTVSTVKTIAFWAFVIAFAIKVPVWPFHTWLPDAHTEAPTAGSMILAGVLLKLGAYGFLRLVLPFYPVESARFAGWLAFLAVMAIVFGAFAAFGQKDFKRLVAYSSVNHMGFVVLGIAAAAKAAGTLNATIRIEWCSAADVQPRSYRQQACSSWWVSSTNVPTPATWMILGVCFRWCRSTVAS